MSWNLVLSNVSRKSSLHPRASLARRGVGAWRRALLVTGTLLAAVSPAGAASVDVFFDGAGRTGSKRSFGISLDSAINARDNFGVPILTSVDLLTERWKEELSVTLPPRSSLVIDPKPPTASQNTVISNWQIENISGSALTGASYLLFTHTKPFKVGNNNKVKYDDASVGLRIDAGMGWVIIRGQEQGTDYYYPALLLDRSVTNPVDGDLSAGERVTAAIHYVLKRSLIGFQKNGVTKYHLPKHQLGFAQVVPEPGTAILLGLGLTVLSARRKRA